MKEGFLYNFKEPFQLPNFGAVQYNFEARKLIDEFNKNELVPIVEGGSQFLIKHLFEGTNVEDFTKFCAKQEKTYEEVKAEIR